MKKILPLCLLAALLASCEKPNPAPEPQPQVDAVTVTFNGESWTSGLTSGLYHTAYDAIDLRAYRTGVEDYPFAFVCFRGSQPGTHTDHINAPSIPQQYEEDVVEFVEYYESHTFHDEDGYLYGDWWAKTVSIDIRQFDATSLRCDLVCTAEMFSVYDISFLGRPYEEARTAPMVVSATVQLDNGTEKIGKNR